MSKMMNRREFMKASAATGAILMSGNPSLTFAQELKPIQLLPPQFDGGRPLMQALKDRKSSRRYNDEKIPLQVLSNLLWVAFGINRSESGRPTKRPGRTAPTGGDRQDIDIYVATDVGVYVYDAKANILNPVLAEDVRGLSGRQYPPPTVPVNMVPPVDEALLISSMYGIIRRRVQHQQRSKCCVSPLPIQDPSFRTSISIALLKDWRLLCAYGLTNQP